MNDYNFLQTNIKCEEKEDCQFLNESQSSILITNKTVVSPSNCDYENVDIESIDIDDIFNESICHDGWGDIKDYNMLNMSEVSCNHGINSISSMNSDTVTFVQAVESRSQFDNKYFIADILNRQSYCYNGEKFGDNNPTLSYVLNNNVVGNNVRQISCESDISQSINAEDSDLSNLLTGGYMTSSNITRNKAIMPMIADIPNKRLLNGKMGRLHDQLCSVCSDSATGKHYGVVSCEGCKGFFKRTIRNNLTYKCRDFGNCSVDKKFRNRCQACRFQKCTVAGMKREAVQIEKSDKRTKQSNSIEARYPISGSSLVVDDSLENIYGHIFVQINSDNMLRIETTRNPEVEEIGIFEGDVIKVISEIFNDHLFSLVSWAKFIPGFSILSLSDQTLLLKMCWGELAVANFVHRSLKLKEDVILMRNGATLIREIAHESGIGQLIDRVIVEVLHRFRDLHIDHCELSFMKAIMLFNPNLKDLANRALVQLLRVKCYSSLQAYCLDEYPTERFRFTKLLLRLPSLRSVAYVTLDHFRLHDMVERGSGEAQDGEGTSSFFDEMLSHSDIMLDH